MIKKLDAGGSVQFAHQHLFFEHSSLSANLANTPPSYTPFFQKSN